MAPTRIVLIRHAEKPSGVAQGVDLRGRPDPHGLTPRGWQRAGALVALFAGSGVGASARPTAVFAAGTNAESPSRRSIDTVTPLVDRLCESADVPLVVDHLKQDHEALARDVATRTGTVLVCWEYRHLPAVARCLGPGAAVPPAWPVDRFDLIWLLEHENDRWRFAEQRQHLLSGDAP